MILHNTTRACGDYWQAMTIPGLTPFNRQELLRGNRVFFFG